MGYNLRKIQCKGIVIKKWLGNNSREDTEVARNLFERVPCIYKFLVTDINNQRVLFLQEQPYGDKGQLSREPLGEYVPKATTMAIYTRESWLLMENTVYAKNERA